VNKWLNDYFHSELQKMVGDLSKGKGEWISVDDALPEKEGQYICHFSDAVIETFYYEPEDKFKQWGVHNVVVTHWMLLPEPPKGEQDE